MIMESVAEDLAIAGGLIGVHCVTAGYAVLSTYLMTLEVHPLTYIILTSFSTFIVFFPFAIYLER